MITTKDQARQVVDTLANYNFNLLVSISYCLMRRLEITSGIDVTNKVGPMLTAVIFAERQVMEMLRRDGDTSSQ